MTDPAKLPYPAKVLRNEDGTLGVAMLDKWGRVDPFRDLITDAPVWSADMARRLHPVYTGAIGDPARPDYQHVIWMQ